MERGRQGANCSCFLCDNDAPLLACPLRTEVFHNPVGSCCHSCGLGSGSLGLLLGTWAGLLQGGTGESSILVLPALERPWGGGKVATQIWKSVFRVFRAFRAWGVYGAWAAGR